MRVLLGVTGGIAAYKSAELTRRLMERGADVQVVMTAGAREFVTPLTFQALSGRPVRTDLWDAAAEAAMGHIELARWPQRIVIAPATADFIARLAHGLADDLLSTLCLATDVPIVVVPAMNRLMWANRRDAGQRHGVAPARRRDPRSGRGCAGLWRNRGRPHGRAARDRRRAVCGIATAAAATRHCADARSSSRPGRRASASIPCGSSPIAAPARWVTRLPRQRAMPVPTSSS